MKKIVALILAIVLCCSCVACGSSTNTVENVAPETIVQETVTPETSVETFAETEPEETIPELAEPDSDYFKNPMFNFGNTEEITLEVYDCRMYATENETTIFAVDYKTDAGLQFVVCAYADDGDDEPNYWFEVEELTTDELSTLVFEMDNDLLEEIYQPVILIRDKYHFYVGEIDVLHREIMLKVTDGNPIGEPIELSVSKYGNVTVHSADMQALDNGYIRFSIDCKPQKNRYISFYNPPECDRFMFFSKDVTSGERETIMVDVRKEDVEGVFEMNMNFFNGDAEVARIFLSAPITDFETVYAENFAGFIGGNQQFALLYYGFINEAILGATLTAEDGTTMVITEDVLEKNGDGYTIVFFKECQAKRGDTVSLTLSKEGYEDITIEVFVN